MEDRRHGGVTFTYLSATGTDWGVAPAYAVFDGTGLLATSKEEAFKVIDAAHGAPNAMSVDAVTSALDAVPGSEQVLYLDLAGIVNAVADRDDGSRDPREPRTAPHPRGRNTDRHRAPTRAARAPRGLRAPRPPRSCT